MSTDADSPTVELRLTADDVRKHGSISKCPVEPSTNIQDIIVRHI